MSWAVDLGRAEEAARRRNRGVDGGLWGRRARGRSLARSRYGMNGERGVACCLPPAAIQRASPNGEIPDFILSPH